MSSQHSEKTQTRQRDWHIQGPPALSSIQVSFQPILLYKTWENIFSYNTCEWHRPDRDTQTDSLPLNKVLISLTHTHTHTPCIMHTPAHAHAHAHTALPIVMLMFIYSLCKAACRRMECNHDLKPCQSLMLQWTLKPSWMRGGSNWRQWN